MSPPELQRRAKARGTAPTVHKACSFVFELFCAVDGWQCTAEEQTMFGLIAIRGCMSSRLQADQLPIFCEAASTINKKTLIKWTSLPLPAVASDHANLNRDCACCLLLIGWHYAVVTLLKRQKELCECSSYAFDLLLSFS